MRSEDATKRFTLIRGASVVWVLATLLTTGCDVSSMGFVQDERIKVVDPPDRSVVSLPVTLRWQVRDFTVTGRDGNSVVDAGYFAVFVDRPPIPAGKSLKWYALQDGSCGDSACGKVDNLANIYVTEEASLELTSLPDLRERGEVERHEAVIVLLDGTGARIGESAFYVRFSYERGA